MAGFYIITNKLKENYQMLTLGGDAELELVDSLDPFSEGIMFRFVIILSFGYSCYISTLFSKLSVFFKGGRWRLDLQLVLFDGKYWFVYVLAVYSINSGQAANNFTQYLSSSSF